jgi:hypothetical protein
MALHDIAARLAEACAGNPSAFRFHDVIVAVIPLPADTGFDPAVLEAQTAPTAPHTKTEAAPPAPVPPTATPAEVRTLARQAAAKHGADAVRSKLGKGVGEMSESELTAAASALRGML